jgi:hypothetical protein
MVNAPGRAVPRFFESQVEEVRREIAYQLDALDIRQVVSSVARGADILFIEELLKRGGTAQVLSSLPAGRLCTDVCRLRVGPTLLGSVT